MDVEVPDSELEGVTGGGTNLRITQCQCWQTCRARR